MPSSQPIHRSRAASRQAGLDSIRIPPTVSQVARFQIGLLEALPLSMPAALEITVNPDEGARLLAPRVVFAAGPTWRA